MFLKTFKWNRWVIHLMHQRRGRLWLGTLLKQEYSKIYNRFYSDLIWFVPVKIYMFYKIDRIGENRKSVRCSLQACSSNKLLKEKPVKEKRKCNWKTVVMNGGGLLQEDQCIYDSHAKARRQIHSLKFLKYIPNNRWWANPRLVISTHTSCWSK